MNWLFQDLLVAVFILVASFIAHEAGHIMTAQKLGYAVKARFKKLNFEVSYWPNVTQHDEVKVLNRGIWFGFALSLLSVLLCIYWAPMVLILYFVGCRYDLRRLKVLYNHLGNRNI